MNEYPTNWNDADAKEIFYQSEYLTSLIIEFIKSLVLLNYFALHLFDALINIDFVTLPNDQHILCKLNKFTFGIGQG